MKLLGFFIIGIITALLSDNPPYGFSTFDLFMFLTLLWYGLVDVIQRAGIPRSDKAVLDVSESMVNAVDVLANGQIDTLKMVKENRKKINEQFEMLVICDKNLGEIIEVVKMLV